MHTHISTHTCIHTHASRKQICAEMGSGCKEICAEMGSGLIDSYMYTYTYTYAYISLQKHFFKDKNMYVHTYKFKHMRKVACIHTLCMCCPSWCHRMLMTTLSFEMCMCLCTCIWIWILIWLWTCVSIQIRIWVWIWSGFVGIVSIRSIVGVSTFM